MDSCWTEKSNWVVRKAALADSDGEDETGRLNLDDVKPAEFQVSPPSSSKGRKSIAGGRAFVLPGQTPQQTSPPDSPSSDRHDRNERRKSVADSFKNVKDRRQSTAAALVKRQSMAGRMSIAGGRGRMSISGGPRERILGPDEIRQMRPKVSAMMNECMQMANFRLLQALAKNQELLQVESRDMMKFDAAWPYETLAPLVWVPHFWRPQLESCQSEARALSYLLLKTPKQGYGRIEVRLRHRKHFAEQERSNQGQFNPLDSHVPEVLHEAFHQALAEAKMAQSQAQAARNEVQRLRGAIDKMKKRSTSNEPTTPCWVVGSPRPPGSPLASSRDLPQVSARGGQVLPSAARKEQLRLQEASLEASLREVEKQNLQLEIEVRRQERRVLLSSSASPQAIDEVAKALPKLIDCKLPISPKTGKAKTPRLPASPRTPGKAGGASGKSNEAKASKPKLPRIAFFVDDGDDD